MMQPNHSQNPKKAAIYTRHSQVTKFSDTYSTQAQIDACKAYCAKQGYIISEDQIYGERRDGPIETRPERDRLRKEAEDGLISVLVIESRDRLTRDAKAYTLFREQLEALGIAVEIVDDMQSKQ